MKKSVYLSALALAVLVTSCKLESLSYYDDVYSSSRDSQYEVVRNTSPAPQEEPNYAYTEESEDSYSEENPTYIYDENGYTNDGEAYSDEKSYYESDGNGNTYITNNYYYDEDDYDD